MIGLRLCSLGIAASLALACLAAPSSALAGGHGGAPKADDSVPHEGPAGVPLGDFSFRDVRSLDGAEFRIDFTLYAVIDANERALLVDELGRVKSRVRDQVGTAVRMTPVADFQEPELTRLRRRILLGLNRAVPSLGVKQVAFSGFAFYSN